MKAKIICFISFFLFFTVIFTFVGTAEDTAPSPAYVADCFALFDIDTEYFLIDQDIDKLISPSSSVKIMSGLIACERLASSAEDIVTVTAEMLEGAYGKSMGLSEGKQIKIKDLMFAAYGCGYNDAATALAVIAAGNEAEMVELMNARAKELSLYSTYYTNVTGLDDHKMKTTVRDLVNLTVAASQNELFVEVSSVYNYTVKYADGEERTLYGSNEILNKNSPYYCASARGMNSGATDSGACLINYGEARGKRFVVVAMGCSSDNDTRFALIQNALDWGYKNSYITLAERDDPVGNFKVDMSQTKDANVSLVLSEDLAVFLYGSENKDKLRYTVVTDGDSLNAPIKKGDTVGKYVVWYGNEIRGIADITVSEDVEKSVFLVFLDRVEGYLTGRAFIITAAVLLVSSVIFFLVPKLALLRRQKQRKYVKTRSGFDLKNKK